MLIKGYKNTLKMKIKDKIGYFSRKVELKRLSKYENEIDMVLTKYNKKSCDETMMVKGLRKSNPETTNRKTHQEDLEKIVAQMAKELGLNEDIVKIMGKHHDIGHTFLGHSGEWWISNILDDYGLGCYCHNTLGARELIYTNQVYDEIINKIKVHNPNVSEKTLKRIRNSLWLIFDGINAHNGEKPEKEYVPDITKAEYEFVNEMVSCYTKKGYDRKITPASTEACLMRLADQISYIPLDMLDGLREKMIRDKNGNIVTVLDDDYKDILIQLGISEQEIEECNIKGTYNKIAERLKEIFINDVVKNSTRQRITMSEETMKLMNELRNLNNSKIVDNVILIEDQGTYPAAIRALINRYKNIILENSLLKKLANASSDMSINEDVIQYYETVDEGFVKFICNMNEKDYKFTKLVANQATLESIKDELSIARECVLTRTQYEEQEEYGLNYDMKNGRIKQYIQYYLARHEKGQLIGYDDKQEKSETEKIYYNIMENKQSENYLGIDEAIAIGIAAHYVSTLNDHEFITLLQDAKLITEEQYKSLTRKYKDISDLKKEVYVAKRWKEISKTQKEATVQEQK